MTIRLRLACALLVLSSCAAAQTPPAAFDGVEKWSESLTASANSSLKSLYSIDPPAKFVPKGQKAGTDISPELDFWQKLISSGATDFTVSPLETEDRQGLHLVTLAVSMKIKTADGPRTRYVTEEQAWQRQNGGWRIVLAKHSEVVRMPPALHPNPNLYDTRADAKVEIEEAVAKAKKDNQRVILVFGANWCYDCHVLDQAFHQAEVSAILQRSFQVVHVDIGDDGKKNRDVAADYQVPLGKGIPALAILDSDGKLLYSQKGGEWEAARSLDPDEIVGFLKKWER